VTISVGRQEGRWVVKSVLHSAQVSEGQFAILTAPTWSVILDLLVEVL